MRVTTDGSVVVLRRGGLRLPVDEIRAPLPQKPPREDPPPAK